MNSNLLKVSLKPSEAMPTVYYNQVLLKLSGDILMSGYSKNLI